MLSFTEADLAKIRSRATAEPAYVKNLEENALHIRRKLYIQEKTRSTWGHFYACPKHGNRLIYNYDDSEHYVCPVDGEIFTGEPYLGGWWARTEYINANETKSLSLLYLLNSKEEDLEIIKRVLLGHAKYYKDYEVHGNIPYNNPGKMMAQVLDDSCCLIQYADAFDYISDKLTEEEKEFIKNGLFLPGAEHLKRYLTPQLHNHEVAITTTLGSIGLVIGDDALVEYALNTKYGIKYQLDCGMLKDCLWFEGSFGYHLYALKHILHFEKMARYTKYSLLADEHYRRILYEMLIFPIKISDSKNILPCTNDGHESLANRPEIYEYAYTYFKTPEILRCLMESRTKNGINEARLFYGEDELPSLEERKLENYLSTVGSQLAVLHGSENRYLLFKAMPFGGEHDHYDRLSVSFSAFGRDICTDFGTTAYGSPLHYGYFKNTASHNTVVIDGENMAPCKTLINSYRRLDDGSVYLDAETEAPEGFVMPDSFTIKQWSEESYAGVRMRRVISWQDKYFIDCFTVKSDNTLRKEWVWHTDGVPAIPEGAKPIPSPYGKGAQSYLHDFYLYTGDGVVKTSYDCDGIELDVHSFADGLDILYAKGPANPAVKDVSYLMLRSYDSCPVYLNVIEAHKPGQSVIESVSAERCGDILRGSVKEQSGKSTHVDIII